ncbi:hypothetical protein [Providencia sneebia]|uniref:Uncharacterized protein n=1 Tax=Providencia sneebia DSM 19967 TaxID=1141660 RepID=K8WJP1_9GAMM|nr:hypothetical protein [Providencia sneebia]EKT56380.1 hypothetical protein OO7_10592 [Providencia sneebia DSM 19967]
MTKIYSKPLNTDESINCYQTDDNNYNSSSIDNKNLANQIKQISNITEQSKTTQQAVQLSINATKKNKKAKVERAFIQRTTLYPSAKNEVVAFKYQLKKSKRPLVHFPPSARGDMNSYKYIGFLEQRERPLTMFEYVSCKNSDAQELRFNNNLPVIIEHINSMGSRLKEGRDYIFCNKQEIDSFQEESVKIKNYQYYDSIVAVPELRKDIHKQFRDDIATNPKIKSYFDNKALPCTGEETFIRKNRLIMVNVNKRPTLSQWEPREYRHTTPDFTHLKNLVDCVYEAKKEANQRIQKDKFDICFVGSEFTMGEQGLWKEYAMKKGVNVHFFNDLAKKGFNRLEQREALFALSDQYKSTIYFGLQSGVNEDAPILPRTNVYSLSEYLKSSQVGINRIEKRAQLDIIKKGPLGVPMHASTVGNFYSLRNCEFLTTEGILAAIQLKDSTLFKQHQPLDKLWAKIVNQYAIEVGNENTEIPDERATDALLTLILDNGTNTKVNEETKNNYRDVVNIIVQRMKGKMPYFSEAAKKYFTDVMKEELTLHDSHEPLTQNERKREIHNAGITPFTSKLLRHSHHFEPRGKERIGMPDNPKDNALNLLYSTGKRPLRKALPLI